MLMAWAQRTAYETWVSVFGVTMRRGLGVEDRLKRSHEQSRSIMELRNTLRSPQEQKKYVESQTEQIHLELRNPLQSLQEQNKYVEVSRLVLHGQPMNNLPSGYMTSNPIDLVHPDALILSDKPIEMSKIIDPSLRSSRPISNRDDDHEQLVGGIVNPLDLLEGSSSKNHFSDSLKSAFATSVNCGYDGVLGSINNKWDFNKFLPYSDAAVEISGREEFHPLQLVGNGTPNCWTPSDTANLTLDNSSGSSKSCNELCLSLATFKPSVIHRTSIQDDCSEIGYSGVTHSHSDQKLFDSEISCNSNGSHRPVQRLEFLSKSRYLRVIQEILAEIASCSFSAIAFLIEAMH
ncbi:hypothetical protein RHSIM_RhsimUnG0250000 [Rhododendron simsii]|uniref:Uncharacterized protein n=1 Tax=Rhododendron simsii TaxID=118357 RepID=A0A834L3K8_RHOSS|nr:hypothetical protein RHSIM_RhsimUnG0250000 [Rhododendron simsii]